LIIDNASQSPIAESLSDLTMSGLRVVRENRPGLSWARYCAVENAKAQILVFVDDDNVLDPQYLEHALGFFDDHPKIGVIGGKSIPEFAHPPEPWVEEFYDLLALRDQGNAVITAPGFTTEKNRAYPICAPIGAGMAIRKLAIDAWVKQLAQRKIELSDRKGNSLSSSGDNDIVLCALEAGYGVAYVPELSLTHVITADRCSIEHLSRLNQGIQKSWVQVLALHQVCPWSACSGWTLPIRKFRALIRSRGWRKPQAYIRWCGQCGHFEGRAIIGRMQ